MITTQTTLNANSQGNSHPHRKQDVTQLNGSYIPQMVFPDMPITNG